ncbi:MAG: hypothetical protein LBK70_03645 [Clostridiales bacterium]|nr:hypothetical protein [Clostridiales bacterium]
MEFAKKLDNNKQLRNDVIDILFSHNNNIILAEVAFLGISFGYRIEESFQIIDMNIQKYYNYFIKSLDNYMDLDKKQLGIDMNISLLTKRIIEMLLRDGCIKSCKDQQDLTRYDIKWLKKKFDKYIKSKW